MSAQAPVRQAEPHARARFALPSDDFTHVLELLSDALVRGDDGIEGIADLARDARLRSRQTHREIAGLHRVQRVEQFVQIEIRRCGNCARNVAIGLFLASDARN